MRRLVVLLSVAIASVAVGLALTAGGANATTTFPPDGCGPGIQPNDVTCGYEEEDFGEANFHPGPGTFQTQGGAFTHCKTVWGRRTRRNLFGFVVFRYNEQVSFCWSNSKVSYFFRERWPSDLAATWDFDGHVAGNCEEETCSGHIGQYVENAWTQGKFHACILWLCNHKLATVSLTVYGDGTWAGTTSGG